jgi:WD40 repeat protein
MSVDSDGGFYRWDYQKQKVISKLFLETGDIVHSAISSDGNYVATGFKEGTVILWDGQTGRQLFQGIKHSAPIVSLVFSPNGKQLASSDSDGNVILWNVTPGKLEASHQYADPQQMSIPALLFSGDGKRLVGGGCGYPISFPSADCSRGTIYIWDTTLKLQDQLPGSSGFVWSLAFNSKVPNELAAGSRDGTVTIWNLQNRTTRLTFRLDKNDVTSLAFSPDGKLLAVGAQGYKVFVYDARTGQKYGQAFLDHDANVIALRFSPDGNKLLSASSDYTVVIHDMNPKDWQDRACQLANRNFTRAEWEQYIGTILPYQAVCPQLPIETERAAKP